VLEEVGGGGAHHQIISKRAAADAEEVGKENPSGETSAAERPTMKPKEKRPFNPQSFSTDHRRTRTGEVVAVVTPHQPNG
jgi:hypothetical protein